MVRAYGSANPVTIAGLLDGKQLLYPRHRVEMFARVERKAKHEQEKLF